MRRLFIFVIALGCVLLVGARNYFKPGMVWEMKAQVCGGEGDVYYWNCHVGPDTVLFGQRCNLLEESDYYDSEYVNDCKSVYVRAEGDVVYVLPDSTVNEWFVLYDFGLQPGESCQVYNFKAVLDQPQTLYVKCVKIIRTRALDGWPVMYVEEYADAGCTELLNPVQDVWYDGLGSPVNPFFNSGRGDYIGYGGSVQKFVFNGTELNEKTLSQGEIETGSRPAVLPGDELYDCSGRRVKEPCRGVYVNGTTGRLVMVR